MKNMRAFFCSILLMLVWVSCSVEDPNQLADEFLQIPYHELNMTPKQRRQVSDMTKAMDDYATANYARAIPQFKAMIDSFKSESISYFYMGLSQIYIQKYPESIESFKQSIAFNPDLYDYTCNWYTALAYIKMGQNDKAVPHLKYLLEHDLDKPLYKDNANRLLNAIKHKK